MGRTGAWGLRDTAGTAMVALSTIALVTSTTAACCFFAVWTYWYRELDADCPDGRDCKCLLFATSFADGFVGGQRSACRYVFYAAFSSAALAACSSAYIGCRSLLCRRQRPPAAAAARHPPDDGRGRAVVVPTRTPSTSVPRPVTCSPQVSGLTICFAIILGFIALNMLIASVVLSNGYISTCREYVHRVKSFLMVTGNMVELVSNRMSCGTIYDFLDYLQPPSRQISYELIHRHKTNPRDYLINTSMLLTISIVMSWLSTLTWTAMAICIFFFR